MVVEAAEATKKHCYVFCTVASGDGLAKMRIKKLFVVNVEHKKILQFY